MERGGLGVEYDIDFIAQNDLVMRVECRLVAAECVVRHCFCRPCHHRNGLSNGDVGVIVYLKNSEGEQSDKADKTLKAIFLNENGKPKAIGTDRISDFDEGYAITIHKSQGSEYTNVIVALFEKDNPMITKELVYTAITRAKGYVDKNGDTVPGTVKFFCGTEAFFKGIKRSIERDSNLAEMIHK